MSAVQLISQKLRIPTDSVHATIQLLTAGNTIPFIARYRKEVTGNLDEDQIRKLAHLNEQQIALAERRQTILGSIAEQGKLTAQLNQKILDAEDLTELEDLYAPYKPKRQTRASVARERGLQGLADLIIAQKATETVERLAGPYVTEHVPTISDVLAGARDIVAEMVSDNTKIRQRIREKAWKWGLLCTEKIADATDEKSVFQNYYTFECRVDRLRPYQILAINRGELEKVLRVWLDIAERDWRLAIERDFEVNPKCSLAQQLELAVTDGAKRLLLPAIERDVRRTLTETAEAHAIQVFARNLRGLLTQPPMQGKIVLGIDPGYRSGCKLAVINPTGKVVATATIYPNKPQSAREASRQIVQKLVEHYHIQIIAIGNGTASRDTEQFVVEFLRDHPINDLQYLMVDEAGASVYSASELARQELPDLDVTLRGAASIARRIQDPLAELVKIDPQSIGVGLYQHDVNQGSLKKALQEVIESVVNAVGVDVNTASPALLTYVAGIGPKLAEKMVTYRNEYGAFPTRQAFLMVGGFGPKTFEQAAGFLRIKNGENPLDASAIHPESYHAANAVLAGIGVQLSDPLETRQAALAPLQVEKIAQSLATSLGVGLPTLNDIFQQILRPGLDPRSELPTPILRNDVLQLSDLKPGLQLKGTVRNVVDFGAFVDIGVKQDGLLHRTELSQHGANVKVGDVIEVKVLKVESERGRISLGWI